MEAFDRIKDFISDFKKSDNELITTSENERSIDLWLTDLETLLNHAVSERADYRSIKIQLVEAQQKIVDLEKKLKPFTSLNSQAADWTSDGVTVIRNNSIQAIARTPEVAQGIAAGMLRFAMQTTK